MCLMKGDQWLKSTYHPAEDLLHHQTQLEMGYLFAAMKQGSECSTVRQRYECLQGIVSSIEMSTTVISTHHLS